ncbi:hypothetical protein [Microbulbifer sp. 2205BS26-8]|uniref:hypothetical protein n=1 Tax=Microbulbifer sp. 2205BS26-8 TaxID=3064386 RepID=UPI00273E9CAF|nr:hypothetical protein [Microbulbifer sp. 2205BS26-8]MDP5211352.1 hypothetical protein [Microbulbifer sp. 2205BS26-8]
MKHIVMLLSFVLTTFAFAEEVDTTGENLIILHNNTPAISQVKTDGVFAAAPNRWACYAVYPGNGINQYVVGSPSQSRELVAYLAVNRCNNVNNSTNCYIQECRYGQY